MKVRHSVVAGDKHDKEARYKGQVQDTIREGQGVYNFPWGGNDLFSYEGLWAKGQREGAHGKFVIAGFSEYTGQFIRGEMTGVGTRKWSNGNEYEGEFLDGECHGKGKWRNCDGSEIYEGEFCCNRRQGKGTLRKGAYVYRGQFESHKMNGFGIFLRENLFFVESTFKQNIIQGTARIKWHKLCDLECNIVNGYPDCGRGVFTTSNGSFDFEGPWSKGFPVFEQTAKYIWSDLDRSMVKDPEPESDPGKKKAAAPPKKKGAADDNEPSLVAFAGVQLGKVVVRTGRTAENEFPVPPPNPKAAKGEPLPKPVMPIPEPFSVPCERRRLVTLRLRPELLSSDGVVTLGEPTNLWLRKQTLNEFGSCRLRFPPAATVFIDGECAGSPRSPAPSLSLESRGANAESETSLIDEVLTASPAGGKSETDPSDGVRALKLFNCDSLSFQIDTRASPKSHEAMTFTIDFKLDVAKLDAAFGAKYDVPAMLAVTAAATAATTAPGASRAERRTAKAAISAAATLNRQLQACSSFPVLSLSRVFDGAEVKTSRLQLVLLVPDSNILDLCRALRDPASPVVGQVALTGGSSEEAAGTGSATDKLSALAWLDCIWELRLLTTVMEPVPPEPIVTTATPDGESAPEGDENTAGAGAGAVSAATAAARVEGASAIDISAEGEESAEPATEPEQQFRPVTQTSVCGRWHAASLSPATWHSLALTLRAPTEQSSYDGVTTAPSPQRSSADALAPRGTVVGSDLPSSPSRTMLSATMATAGKSTAVVDLVVDGSSKMRAGIPPSATATVAFAVSAIETGIEGFQLSEEPKGLIGDEIMEGVVLGWLPELSLPQQQEDTEQQQDEEEQERGISNAVKAIGEGALTSPPQGQALAFEAPPAGEPEDFWLLVRAGGPGFEGLVKALSACSKGDRCDIVALTGCFEAHRQQERDWEFMKQKEQQDRQSEEEDQLAGEAKDFAPLDCTAVKEVPLVLFCGSGEIDRIVLPTQTPEGVYVLEVSDGVSEACRRPPGEGLLSVPELQQDASGAEGEKQPEENKVELEPAADRPDPLQRTPEDIKDMCAAVASLPTSRIVRMKVNAVSI